MSDSFPIRSGQEDPPAPRRGPQPGSANALRRGLCSHRHRFPVVYRCLDNCRWASSPYPVPPSLLTLGQSPSSQYAL